MRSLPLVNVICDHGQLLASMLLIRDHGPWFTPRVKSHPVQLVPLVKARHPRRHVCADTCVLTRVCWQVLQLANSLLQALPNATLLN